MGKHVYNSPSFLLNLPDFPYKNIPEYTLKFTLIFKLKLGYLNSYGVYQETLGEDIIPVSL